MAVGVVASDAVAEPEDLRGAEIVAEDLRVIVAGEAGIAFLRGAEQAFFGGEQRAAPVDVDAAAFEHDAAAFVHGLPDTMLEFLVYVGGGDRVLFVIAVFGPSVEPPMRVGDFAGGVAYADRAGIAHPAAVSGNAEEIDGVEIGAGLFQNGADFGFGGAILHEEIDALNAREVP